LSERIGISGRWEVHPKLENGPNQTKHQKCQKKRKAQGAIREGKTHQWGKSKKKNLEKGGDVPAQRENKNILVNAENIKRKGKKTLSAKREEDISIF